MTYLKYVRYGTSRLIDKNNAVLKAEAIEDGFVLEVDEDGYPTFIESDALNKSVDSEMLELEEKIRLKKLKEAEKAKLADTDDEDYNSLV